MTDIELINNYILGEKENIECLKLDMEACADVKIKSIYEHVIDTTERITQLENIKNKLKALEIIKNSELLWVSNRYRTLYTRNCDDEQKLTDKECELLKEVLE